MPRVTDKSRFTIDLGEVDEHRLNRLTKSREISKAEVIRRALALYDHLDREMDTDRRLTITDRSQHILKEIVFL